MEKAYNKYTFVNNQEPALSAQTLNDISNAIDTIDDRVVAMGDIQGAAQEALMQAQLANAQTYENSRVAADSAEKAMSTTPTGYNQKMVQLNNLRNAPAYSSTKAYAVGDVVDYNDSIYKCKLACTNIKPTNTTYWTEVNVKTIEDDITRLNVDLSDGLNGKISTDWLPRFRGVGNKTESFRVPTNAIGMMIFKATNSAYTTATVSCDNGRSVSIPSGEMATPKVLSVNGGTLITVTSVDQYSGNPMGLIFMFV